VKPERLHLTLHFLGDVAASQAAELKDALEGVPFVPVTLRFGEPQTWGAGIAVLRPHETPDALRELHTRVGLALSGIGVPLEERPYRPHVTLARRASGAKPPQEGPGLHWQADGGFVLARTLGGGRGYEAFARFGVT
jgi:2'-5' RNA ligase